MSGHMVALRRSAIEPDCVYPFRGWQWDGKITECLLERGTVGLANHTAPDVMTKMNWNSSEGVGSYPITLLFAKRVGELMCEFGKDDSPNPSYRFYV